MLIIDHGNHSPLYYAHHSLTSWCQWHFPSWLQISAVNIHFCTKGTRRGVRFALSGFRDACIGPMTDLGVLFCLQWHHWWFLLLALSELSNVFQTPVLQEIGPSSLLEIGVLATLCNPMDRSPPGSSVHRILQARILEWGAISFSRGSSQPRHWTQVSCIAGRFLTIWATREALDSQAHRNDTLTHEISVKSILHSRHLCEYK